MSRAIRVVIAICFATGFFGLAGTAHAGSSKAEAAARTAQHEHGGRVLKVERRDNGYRVKLLKKSGKVKVVFVPETEKRKGKGKGKGGRVEEPRHRFRDFGQRPVRASR